MKNLALFVLLFIAGNVVAQHEVISNLTYNRAQEADMLKRAERLRHGSAMGARQSLELPFIDDFSTDKFPGNEDGLPVHWLDLKTYRNNTFAINPPTIGVVTFDGADEYGYPYDWDAGNAGVPCDTLTSVPINLDYDTDDNIWLSFFFQGAGFGERPEPEDSLFLEFYSPLFDQWFWVWSNKGEDMDTFEKVFLPITQEKYLMDGFQFRFINYATPLGALDHWNLDYVHLDRNREQGEVIDDVAYVYPIRTLLEDYSSMPWKHFVQNPSSFMANSVESLIFSNNEPPPPNEGTGNRTVENRTIRVFHEGNLQAENVNLDEPPIGPQSFLTLTEPVSNSPMDYVYDPDVDDVYAIFDVELTFNVSPDFIQTNNRTTMRQEFYSHYAYDDGSPERAYSVTLVGSRTAMRYVNTMPDSLIGLMIWFEAINEQPGDFSFFPTVWEASGTGIPGEEIVQGLWEGVTFEPDTVYGWRLYRFLEPVFLPEGAFFVGTVQTIPEGLKIGLDYNSSYNQGNLFYFSNPNGMWLPSSSPGTLMVRPVFQSSNIGPLSDELTPWEDAQIFPNPASDVLFVDPGSYLKPAIAEVYNLTGQMVQRSSILGQTAIDTNQLPAGIYVLRLAEQEAGVQRSFKFVKR